MDRGEIVVGDQLLGHQNRVLEVVAAPGHERHQDVTPEGQLAEVGAGAVGEDVPLLQLLPHLDHRLLVDAGVLVGALELGQVVDIGAEVFVLLQPVPLPRNADDDPLRVDVIDRPLSLAEDHRARVLGGDLLHPGTHQRSLGPHQRHRLALHVRAHQRPVGVVVFQERDERRRHRHELLRRHVDELHLVALDEFEFAGHPRGDAVLDDPAVLGHLDVGLGDDPLVLLPGGQVEGMRLVIREPDLLVAPELLERFLQLRLLDDLAELGVRLSLGGDPEEVHDHAVLHLPVGRLDEPEFIDPRVARQRRDESDVRTFRRLDRADPPIVRRVDVAHLEPGALARQPARSEGREAPLVGDLRERVGLVHELRQLRRAEELLDRRHDRLGVDQVVRHRRGHFLIDRHLLLDGALHADQTDPELVLEELADRPHPAVAEVVDVVDPGRVATQAEQVEKDQHEVLGRQHALGQRQGRPELGVHLQAADPAQVIPVAVEEHPLEERARPLQRGGIAGTQAAVDLDQRLLRSLDGILADRLAQDRADVGGVREKQLDAGQAPPEDVVEDLPGHLVIRLEKNLAAPGVDDVLDGVGAFELLRIDRDPIDAGLLQERQVGSVDLLAAPDQDLLALLVGDVGADLLSHQAGRHLPEQLPVLHQDRLGAVEPAQHLFVGLETEGPQNHRAEELALPVDPDVQQILVVVLELQPGAAIRDHLGHPGLLVIVALEEDARRAVQLGDDDALGAVDDEGAVLGQERDLAEIDLLLLDVADLLRAGGRLLFIHDQADLDLERHGEVHAALLTLGHVVLELERHRVAAHFAVIDAVLVRPAAVGADVAGSLRVLRDRLLAAFDAGDPEMLQPFQLAALAFPVADGVLDELQRAGLAEIADRKDRLEDGLQSGVVPILRRGIDLQEALVRALLDLDEVRDRNRRVNLGKVDALAPAGLCRSGSHHRTLDAPFHPALRRILPEPGRVVPRS